MRGEVLDAVVPATTELPAPDARNYRTIAIGDGGSTRAGDGRLARQPEEARQSRRTDLLRRGGLRDPDILNWGAYALVAALSCYPAAGCCARRPTNGAYSTLLVAGAVDGCTKAPALSVDGIPWDAYAATLAKSMPSLSRRSRRDKRPQRSAAGGRR